MKTLIKILCLNIIAILLLSGCAPRPKTVYIQGLQYYHQAHYRDAFENFYYAAYYRYAAAEYATGYMYYYGLGTRKNTVEGIKWFSKAANKGNIDAIKALRKMTIVSYPF